MNFKRLSTGEKIFVGSIHVILVLLAIAMIYPFIYVVSASLSSGAAYSRGDVILLPVEFTTSAYKIIFADGGFWRSLGNSFFYMFIGTAFSMIVSTLGAYALSKERLVLRRFFGIIIAITIWFSAGMIPAYLNYKDLGLFGTRFGIILGFGISAMNIILLRNYFEGIPKALEESAYIDGANDWQIFSRISFPLAKPAIATVSLFYALGRWNEWFWPSIFFQSDNSMSRIPLQSYIRILISQEVGADAEDLLGQVASDALHSPETLTLAVMVCAIIPMILLYPFVQKYFSKGLTLGSVKH